jgi:acetyltransferase-like isoleucine patch superfamily enzyme
MNVGEDVVISSTAIIKVEDLSVIGNHVAIDHNVYISTRILLGDYIHIAPSSCIIGGKTGLFIMDSFSNLSSSVNIIVISDDFWEGMIGPFIPIKYKRLVGGKVKLNKFCTVGANSTVLPDVEMGEGSVLGAGSLLTGSTKPWMIYSGNPAKIIGIRDKTLILRAYEELGYKY